MRRRGHVPLHVGALMPYNLMQAYTPTTLVERAFQRVMAAELLHVITFYIKVQIINLV